MFVLHFNVIDAAASAAHGFRGGGSQRFLGFSGREEGDRAVLGNRPLIMRVAGVGKGSVGQGEDESAVANAVAVLDFLHDSVKISRSFGLE